MLMLRLVVSGMRGHASWLLQIGGSDGVTPAALLTCQLSEVDLLLIVFIPDTSFSCCFASSLMGKRGPAVARLAPGMSGVGRCPQSVAQQCGLVRAVPAC
jgi:hypothetical protein